MKIINKNRYIIFTLIALLAISPITTFAADWPQFMEGEDNNGYSDTTMVPAIDWETTNVGSGNNDLGQNFDAVPGSSAVALDGHVFIFAKYNNDVKLYCLNESNGNVLDSISVGNNDVDGWQTPAVIASGSNIQVIYSQNDYITSNTFNTSTEQFSSTDDWSIDLGTIKTCNSSPTISNSKAYIGNGDTLYARNLATGTASWSFDTNSGKIMSTSAYYDGKVYFTNGKKLYCVDDSTGSELWSISTQRGKEFQGSPCIDGTRVFITRYDGEGGSELCAYNLSNHQSAFNPVNCEMTNATPAYHDGYVYVSGGSVGADKTGVRKFNASTGAESWSENSNVIIGGWNTSCVVTGNEQAVSKESILVLAGVNLDDGDDDYDGICALRAADGDLAWNVDKGGSTPCVTANHIITISDGKVYAYQNTTTPIISLRGKSEITINKGTSWTDPGAVAAKYNNGVYCYNANSAGTVDTNTAGDYTITYSYSGAADVTRTVHVVEDTEKPIIVFKDSQGNFIRDNYEYHVCIDDFEEVTLDDALDATVEDIEQGLSAIVTLYDSSNNQVNSISRYEKAVGYFKYTASDSSGNTADELIVPIFIEDDSDPFEYANSIYEYMPAPGQFVNTTYTHNPEKLLLNDDTSKNKMVSLGGYGGYIVFKFDHDVSNGTGNDLKIWGNPFTGFYEHGAVMVAQDADNNGVPDAWYEIAGEYYDNVNTVHNYQATYSNPDPEFDDGAQDVSFIDNQNPQGSGTVYANAYHTQPYYPNPKLFPKAVTGFDENNYTLGVGGTKIDVSSNTSLTGYADVTSSGDVFDISNAVNSSGQIITLNNIRFVKIYTAVSKDGGMFGEISTEIKAVKDLHQ